MEGQQEEDAFHRQHYQIYLVFHPAGSNKDNFTFTLNLLLTH